MGFNADNLKSLGNQISVPIKTDEDGYLGRECPIKECLGYFKITPGTGIKGPAPCHCPYCGHSSEQNAFWTQEQIEYAKSVVIRQVTDAIHKDLKSMEFNHPPRGTFGIGISLTVTRDAPHPINLLYSVRPNGADHWWVKVPSRKLSVSLVADKRLERVTDQAGAL